MNSGSNKQDHLHRSSWFTPVLLMKCLPPTDGQIMVKETNHAGAGSPVPETL